MTDVDVLSGIGWRELVLFAAALAGLYLMVLVARLFRVVGRQRGEVRQDPGYRMSGWEIYPAAGGAAASPGPQAEVAPVTEPAAAHSFARELAKSGIEAELDGLRRESARLREEMARMTDEIARLKASRNVSPLYSEAMTLAQQGMPPDGIAGHCGISIGEAELVAALARGEAQFDRHDKDENRNDTEPDRGSRHLG